MFEAASCRILVISPTAARAHQFVERVQSLSLSQPVGSSSVAGTSEGVEGTKAQTFLPANKDLLTGPGNRTSIPWTIVNKYYTAEVHFETHELDHFRVHHAVGVPAIIYVWGPGEAYRDHIPEIAQKLQDYEPEVSLAVRFGDSTTSSSSTPATSVDDDGVDEFLLSHGFEFIEGDRAYRQPTLTTNRHSDEEDSGIPGLPRVIDALSTIMWPSILQSDANLKRKSRARDMISWALEAEGDDGLRALVDGPPAAVLLESAWAQSIAPVAVTRKSRMQREMEELERWLEAEETGSGLQYDQGHAVGTYTEPRTQSLGGEKMSERRPAVTSVEDWEDMLTPPAIRTPRADGGFPADPASEHGFEDDFADFVSATAHSRLASHPHTAGLREDRLLEVNYDVGRLTPMHTGTSYRSLGSVSDFEFGANDSMNSGRGLEGGEYGALGDGDEDDDPDLPSHSEVLETTRRIFGAEALSPALETSASTRSGASPSEAQSVARPVSQSSVPLDVDTAADVSLDSEDGDDSNAAFDLSRVFNALQGMKDEIAGMDDENERRRAAARVALGLVYGLGAGGGRPEGTADTNA